MRNNNQSHRFGGPWTETKLDILSQYLKTWLKIFNKNEQARHFKKVYVDAFAGTGYRDDMPFDEGDNLFPDFGEEENRFLKGSVARVMEMDPGFDEYHLIEYNKTHASSLDSFNSDPRVNIVNCDANEFIKKWCKQTNWKKTRAVVFLDPYGMQVNWDTIEAIAATGGIDLWILYPLSGINRMLTRGKYPEDYWQQKLSDFFGTDSWKKEFYKQDPQLGLWGQEDSINKIANFESLGEFFIERLKLIFSGVAPKPVTLKNTRNNPLFLFCFACANPEQRAFGLALKIANHILEKI